MQALKSCDRRGIECINNNGVVFSGGMYSRTSAWESCRWSTYVVFETTL